MSEDTDKQTKMDADRLDEFRILRDDEIPPELMEDDEEDGDPVMSEFKKHMLKADIARKKMKLDMVPLADTIVQEHRYAYELFCSTKGFAGTCDLQGIPCKDPDCRKCAFASMRSSRVSAIMELLNNAYARNIPWAINKNIDDNKEDDDGTVPKGVQPRIREL